MASKKGIAVTAIILAVITGASFSVMDSTRRKMRQHLW